MAYEGAKKFVCVGGGGGTQDIFMYLYVHIYVKNI